MSPVRTLFFLDEVTDLSDGGTGVLEDCEHDVLIVSGTEPSNGELEFEMFISSREFLSSVPLQ